jgi:hypothetical protein
MNLVLPSDTNDKAPTIKSLEIGDFRGLHYQTGANLQLIFHLLYVMAQLEILQPQLHLTYVYRQRAKKLRQKM